MTTTERVCRESPSPEGVASCLEDLVPLATVIAAGCESCTERFVRRALRRGTAAPLIERTLGIVAHLRTRDCFANAVGPEVVARMEKPLRAGRKLLSETEAGAAQRRDCCG